jgi:hypothetical protein
MAAMSNVTMALLPLLLVAACEQHATPRSREQPTAQPVSVSSDARAQVPDASVPDAPAAPEPPPSAAPKPKPPAKPIQHARCPACGVGCNGTKVPSSRIDANGCRVCGCDDIMLPPR